MATSTEQLGREARRIEEDTLFSAKRHFNACSYWNGVHYLIGIPTVVVAALSATFAAGHHDATAGGLAAAAAVLAGLATFVNPHQRAAAHSAFGNRYNAVRNRARTFRELDLTDPAMDADGLRSQLDSLGSQRDHLNEQSPSTPRIAFWVARRGIEQGEAAYDADRTDNG